MKHLKLEIDRHTLACLLAGLQEILDISVNRAEEWGDDMDYETSATYWMLREMFEDMRDRSHTTTDLYKLKTRLSGAMALRFLVEITSPVDNWTNMCLIDMGIALDKYIHEALLSHKAVATPAVGQITSTFNVFLNNGQI